MTNAETPENPTGATAEIPPVNRFQHQGDFWKVAYEGKELLIKDLLGVRYVAWLIRHPGIGFHAFDLIGIGKENPSKTVPLRPARRNEDRILDHEAVQDYLKTLAELRHKLAHADATAHGKQQADIWAEIFQIEQQLRAATGRRGKIRPFSEASEKARKMVSKAISRAIDRMLDLHPSLGRHFLKGIRRGLFCTYEPENLPLWEFSSDEQ